MSLNMRFLPYFSAIKNLAIIIIFNCIKKNDPNRVFGSIMIYISTLF